MGGGSWVQLIRFPATWEQVSQHCCAQLSHPPATPSAEQLFLQTCSVPGAPPSACPAWFRVTFLLSLSPEWAKQDTYKPRRRKTRKSPPRAKGPHAKGQPNVMGNTADLRLSVASGLANCFSLHESFCFLRSNGLPWWSNGKESALQYRGCRFNPWLGNKIPQAAEQLSPRTATRESLHHTGDPACSD